MDPHLQAEGIEKGPEDDYWLSQDYAEDWEEVNNRVERGKIGSKNIYRKEIEGEKGLVTYSMAIAFFDQFNPEYVDIPPAKLQEKNGEKYLVSHGVEETSSNLSEEEVYGFASEMTLLGETDWYAEVNHQVREKPVLIDFDYFTGYWIQNSDKFRENLLEPWIEEQDVNFDEDRFNREMEKRARNLPEIDEVITTLREETRSIGHEELIESELSKLEYALEKAKKGELTIERISSELCPNI